jgi:zinc transport system substrate-binding protein
MVHLSLVWLGLAACVPPSEPVKPVEVSVPAVVFTTSFPARWLAERLSPEDAEFSHLAPAGEDPLSWRPTGAQVAEMGQGALVVANGNRYEAWLETVSLPQGRLVASAAMVPPITLPGTTHSHGVDGEHSHGVLDPHTWMDPQAYLVQAEAVQQGLQGVYPEASDAISAKFRALKGELEDLDRDNKAVVAALPKAIYGSNHPAYNYLFRGLGLPITSFDIDPSAAIDDDLLRKVRGWAEAEELAVLLWEAKPVAAITDVLPGIAHLVIDPLEQPVDGRYDYLRQARANERAFRAFGAGLGSGPSEGVGGAEAAQPVNSSSGM